MPTTYDFPRAIAVVLMAAACAAAQSLEDRVYQARRMQAASGFDEATLDTAGLTPDKRARLGASATPLTTSRGRQDSRQGTNPPLDSMLAGPSDSLFDDDQEPDTSNADSLKLRKKEERKIARRPPKRYEQRIFRSLDRTAFTSAGGAAGKDYVLGPGDEIVVSIWGDKEKEYSLLLNREGKIFLEGIGVVPVGGNNLDQALAMLKQRLARVYSGISRGTTHVDIALGRAGPIRVFVLGEVKNPGGFVFSAHSSVLSAFYYARGPTDIGTVRNLVLTRAGNRFNLDLYDYLMRGESLHPNALRDGDILFAGRAAMLVRVEGDVGRQATFELKPGEGVKELISYAGGLNPTAANQKMVLRRVFENGKLDYVDLPPPQDFLAGKAKFELKDGDNLLIRKSTEASQDFLTIVGPVKYPGTYEATGINTVDRLVAQAGGLREDAFLGRVHIVRPHSDGSSSLFSFSLDSTNLDSITLQPRDNIILYSIKDMYLPDSVQISGAVFKPGKFQFRVGMTAKDLVMQAGGFLPHHEIGKFLVFRGDSHERKTEVIPLSDGEGISKSNSDFLLQANDLVQVPIDPKWYMKEIVTLDGLFLHPGKYALLYPGEKLSSVVQRVGGFKENAYVHGSRFFRYRDSVGRVGVDLAKAMSSPRSRANISLVNGDSIFVPERLSTVKVIGEVGFETSVLFQEGASVPYYIEKAGGFTRLSEPNRVVVQYANGETSRDGYFNRKPDAGSVIYVPKGPEPKPVDWFAGINAILSTVGVALAVVLSIQAISN